MEQRDKKIVHWLALSHHREDRRDRCILLPLGRRRLAVCARCLGLYPVLFVVLAGQIGLGLPPAPRLDWWIALLGPIPALVDWGLSRLEIRRGSNRSRLLTGAVAGAALGRTMLLYFRDPRHEVFLVQLLVIGICVVAVEIARRLRLRGY